MICGKLFLIKYNGMIKVINAFEKQSTNLKRVNVSNLIIVLSIVY